MIKHISILVKGKVSYGQHETDIKNVMGAFTRRDRFVLMAHRVLARVDACGWVEWVGLGFNERVDLAVGSCAAGLVEHRAQLAERDAARAGAASLLTERHCDVCRVAVCAGAHCVGGSDRTIAKVDRESLDRSLTQCVDDHRDRRRVSG